MSGLATRGAFILFMCCAAATYIAVCCVPEFSHKIWRPLTLHLDNMQQVFTPHGDVQLLAVLQSGREVAKWVRVGKARAVVVAPNIEPAEGEAGLSSLLGAILGDASARGIPVVFALSRKRMGQVGLLSAPQGVADAIPHKLQIGRHECGVRH